MPISGLNNYVDFWLKMALMMLSIADMTIVGLDQYTLTMGRK